MRLLITTFLGVLLPTTCAMAGEPAQEPFVLVRAGRPAAAVVYGGDHETVQAAVEDLAHYVHQITGDKLRVTRGVEDTPGPTLHIGETSLYPRLAAAENAIELDGFAMTHVGEDLIIAGRIPQGTANGVTTVLQDHFGVRWYYVGPLWETVPKRATLKISVASNASGGTRVENPSFLGRSFYDHWKDGHFLRRARLTRLASTSPRPEPHRG